MTDLVELRRLIIEIMSLVESVLYPASSSLLETVGMENLVGFLTMTKHVTVSVTINRMTTDKVWIVGQICLL